MAFAAPLAETAIAGESAASSTGLLSRLGTFLHAARSMAPTSSPSPQNRGGGEATTRAIQDTAAVWHSQG